MAVLTTPLRFAEKARSSKRLLMTLPIVIQGIDVDGNPFTEKTQTVVINRGGAKIISKHKFAAGDRLQLTIIHRHKTSGAKVVWIGEKKGNFHEAGVDVDEKTDEFWGVQFPEDNTIYRSAEPAAAEETPPAQPAPEPVAAVTSVEPVTSPVTEFPEFVVEAAEPASEPAAEPAPEPAPAPEQTTQESESPMAEETYPDVVFINAPEQPAPVQSLHRPIPAAQKQRTLSGNPPPSAAPDKFSAMMRELAESIVGESFGDAISSVERQAKDSLERSRGEVTEQVQKTLRSLAESAIQQMESRAAETVMSSQEDCQQVLGALALASEQKFAERLSKYESRGGEILKGLEAYAGRLADWENRLAKHTEAQLGEFQQQQTQHTEARLKEYQGRLTEFETGLGKFSEERIEEYDQRAAECEARLALRSKAELSEFAAVLTQLGQTLTAQYNHQAAECEATLAHAEGKHQEQLEVNMAAIAKRFAEYEQRVIEVEANQASRMKDHLAAFETRIAAHQKRISEEEERQAAKLEARLAAATEKVWQDMARRFASASAAMLSVKE